MSAQKIRIRIVPDVIDRGEGRAKQYTFSVTMENNGAPEGRTFRSSLEVDAFLVGLQLAAKMIAGVELFIPTVSSQDTTSADTEVSSDADVSFSSSWPFPE